MKNLHFGLVAILLAGSAQAEWTKTDYAREYDNCLAACDKSNPREHDKCVSYCGCVTDGMEAQFSDRDRLTREAVQQKMPERIRSLQRLADHCNHQIWRNPARKLKVP